VYRTPRVLAAVHVGFIGSKPTLSRSSGSARLRPMSFDDWMERAVRAFEVLGVSVLAVGSLISFSMAGALLWRGRPAAAYEQLRRRIGRSILLGLEILIIADIVQTITIDPTVESALALGIIVLVRTFLSFSLEVELDGALPWRPRPTRES
jgi:uncharacterized membrane protein